MARVPVRHGTCKTMKASEHEGGKVLPTRSSKGPLSRPRRCRDSSPTPRDGYALSTRRPVMSRVKQGRSALIALTALGFGAAFLQPGDASAESAQVMRLAYGVGGPEA